MGRGPLAYDHDRANHGNQPPTGKQPGYTKFDGDMDEMADSLRIQLAQDVAQHFDRKLYKTGVATTEEERQVEAEKKLLALGVTVGSLQKEAQKKDKEKSRCL